MRWQPALFWALVVANLVVLAWSAGELAARVASHFGFGGAPEEWMSREATLFTAGLIVVALSAVFAGLAHWSSRMPLSLVNVPHKDYWVARERALRTMIREDAYVLGASTLAVTAAAQVAVVLANRRDDPDLGASGSALVLSGVLALLGYTAYLLIWRYRPRPAEDAD